jgi:DNA-binding GntR family transcriptional regulator|tara:strand:- start:53 stop:745 length:693 start_codon:yes stop_codon:yes gene_type:complete
MNIQQSITKKNTRTEILVSEIEKLIVNGSMVPGQRLDEMVLAKKYGVSRTPVREAIRALIAIGLVQNTGKQGSQVAKLSISMLIEMFELMAVLEGMCAQLAARRATKNQLFEMQKTHELLEKTFEKGTHKEFYNVNLQFHDLLYNASHTQYLAEETLRLRRRLSPYRMRVTFQPGRMNSTLEEHNKILIAIKKGESELAKNEAISHLRLIGNDLEDFIASVSSSTKSDYL